MIINSGLAFLLAAAYMRDIGAFRLGCLFLRA